MVGSYSGVLMMVISADKFFDHEVSVSSDGTWWQQRWTFRKCGVVMV